MPVRLTDGGGGAAAAVAAGGSEVSVVCVRASVLYYHGGKSEWVPAGQGLARIDLYKHQQTGAYRVVARSLSDGSVRDVAAAACRATRACSAAQCC